MNLLEMKNLTYYYPESTVPAIRNINLTIEAGSLVLIMGRSGCGKSTLARVMTRLAPEFYGGSLAGEAVFAGLSLREWDDKLFRHIGFLSQDPDSQLVLGQVEREIAFGLENIGTDPGLMKRRVAEIIDYLGIKELRNRPVYKLSGGEKQKVAVAGILVGRPEILILDEPASRLDPVAADDLFSLIKRINQELGITVILVEQRLDRCYHLADQVIVMEKGEIIYQGPPQQQAEWAVENHYPLVPTVPGLFAGLDCRPLPLTIKQGRQILQNLPAANGDSCSASGRKNITADPIMEISRMSFSYPDGTKPVLKNINIKGFPGELVALVGSNGAGKSTFLKLLTGLLQPGTGSIKLFQQPVKKGFNNAAYLPQEVNDFFVMDNLEQEVQMVINQLKTSRDKAFDWLDKLGIANYSNCDPRKLSLGEKHRAALACLLAGEPQVMVLDEPTLGMDIEQKKFWGELLAKLCTDEKKIIIMATHDIDFVSQYCDRVLFIHEGEILSDGSTREVLDGNLFYQPIVTRLFSRAHPSVNTLEQARTVIENLMDKEF